MEEQQIGWIAAIIIGGIAGWLAEQFMKSQMGLVMNIVIGITGAAVASWLLGLLGITFAGWIGYLIAGFIGACILIAIARALSTGLQQRTRNQVGGDKRCYRAEPAARLLPRGPTALVARATALICFQFLSGQTLARQATRRSQYSRIMRPSRETAPPHGWDGPTVWTFDANRARSRSRSLRPAASSNLPRSISQYHRELSPRAV